MNHFKTIAALGLGLALATSVAAAQEEEKKRENETSSFEFTPYFWAAGTKGSATVRGLTTDVGVKFKDLVEDVDFGVMATAKLRLKRWTFTGDFSYMRLTADGDPSGSPFSSSHLDTQLLMGSLTTGYTMTMEDRGLAEFFAGARVMNLDTDLNFDGGGQPATSVSQKKTWVDPIVGANFQFDLGKSWYLHALTDVGGFGVSSWLTGQVLLGASLRLSEHWRISAGYRYISDDFEDGTFHWKIAEHGVVAGVGVRF
jgi:opacity protein-like surface antigen